MSREDERDDREHDEYHRQERNPEETSGEEREDRPRRRRRPPEKKSTSNALLIVGGIGCAILLVCGGLIGFGIYKGMPLIKGMTQATLVSEIFFRNLQQNKVDDAYTLTSEEYRKNNDFKKFADFVKQNDILTKHTTRQVITANLVPPNDLTSRKMMINVTLQADKDSKTCTIMLIKEGEDWKVNSVALN